MILKVAITTVLIVLLPHVITGIPLDINANISSKERENISSQSQTLEQLEETWKVLGKSVYSRRTVRYECPWPFYLIGGVCLRFQFSIRGDWESSRRYCWSLDADLATFEDLDELLLVMAYMNRDTARSLTFWIGGRRYNSSSDFQWLDGSILPDTSSPLWNYKDNEGYNCVVLDYSGASFKLSNVECNVSHNTVCKLL